MENLPKIFVFLDYITPCIVHQELKNYMHSTFLYGFKLFRV